MTHRFSSKRPFEVPEDFLREHIDEMVAATISDLTSEFLLLPKGPGFLEYRDFRDAYEALKRHTSGFRTLAEDRVWAAVQENSRVFCVLRSMLGVTPPEWAELARSARDSDVTQTAARRLDGLCRRDPHYVRCVTDSSRATKTPQRIRTLISVAAEYLSRGAPPKEEGFIHRLAQFDTQDGLVTIRHAASEHVPYPMLLYERYLGRPFASHRDAVSELVGEVMEKAVEDRLREAGITYRRTRRAERIRGFEQAPDFCIPDEVEPEVIIEAKITSDDGTARDKVARILRLAHERDRHREQGRDYEVVACVDGRGFGVRAEDMRQMLEALHGKVFTTATLDKLVQYTRLRNLVSKPAPEGTE